MERVVKRSDLVSEGSSPSASPGPKAIEALKSLGDITSVAPNTSKKDGTGADDDAAIDDGLDFQLFAPTKPAISSEQKPTTQKIKLRSPSIDRARTGFTQPARDSRYYFAEALSSSEKENLEASALSGEQVLASSKLPWPGSAYPWKVLSIPSSHLSKSLRAENVSLFRKLADSEAPKKRTRPGKKYRIKLRTRQKAVVAQQEAAKCQMEAKEAAEREKRTQRNREKKVKKKMKEKAKKAAFGGVYDSAAVESDKDSNSND